MGPKCHVIILGQTKRSHFSATHSVKRRPLPKPLAILARPLASSTTFIKCALVT
uniref:Uncharacterized protein n=1 Tax=Anguilla anguilla TaxID=7936 RepID=A0A0E9VJD7_ANGAN